MIDKTATEVVHRYVAQADLAPVDSIVVIGRADSEGNIDVTALNNVADNVVTYDACEVAADLDTLRSQRWSMAVVVKPAIDKARLVNLLARLRDLHTSRVLHIETAECWSVKDSLALGFAVLDLKALKINVAGSSRCRELQAYEFNLHSYKKTPDWLNARHWANPARWDKFRW